MTIITLDQVTTQNKWTTKNMNLRKDIEFSVIKIHLDPQSQCFNYFFKCCCDIFLVWDYNVLYSFQYNGISKFKYTSIACHVSDSFDILEWVLLYFSNMSSTINLEVIFLQLSLNSKIFQQYWKVVQYFSNFFCSLGK